MPALRQTSRPSQPRGAITGVGVLMFLGIGAAAYLAWVWTPIFMMHYDVKQVVRDFGNQAVKNHDDEQLMQSMVQRLHRLGYVTVQDDDGKEVQRPIVDVQPSEIVWERGAANTLHVAFSYTRTVKFPWTDKQVEREMNVDLTMDTARPDWGPSQ